MVKRCLLFLTNILITKILNTEENSKRKVPNQMAKSKAQTHQTNGLQLSRIESGFIAAIPLTCMTVASNSIILTTMREQNNQTCHVPRS